VWVKGALGCCFFLGSDGKRHCCKWAFPFVSSPDPQRFVWVQIALGPFWIFLPNGWRSSIHSNKYNYCDFPQLAQLDVIATNFFFHSSGVH
jgi:hypothetical protein